jgi:hypothetical protein
MKITGTSIDVSKEVGLEASMEEVKLMLLSRQKIAEHLNSLHSIIGMISSKTMT